MKKERALRADMLRIARMPLDYEALSNIIENVASNNVEVEIKFETGQVMTIKPKTVEKQKTFKEQYQEFRSHI